MKILDGLASEWKNLTSLSYSNKEKIKGEGKRSIPFHY